MATIKDKLEFEIKSIFDNTGFKQFLTSLKAMGATFKSVGLETTFSELEDKISGAEKGIETLSDKTTKTVEKLDPAARKAFESLRKTVVKGGDVTAEQFDKALGGVSDFRKLFPADKFGDDLSAVNPILNKVMGDFKALADLGGVSENFDLMSESIKATSGFLNQGDMTYTDFISNYVKGSNLFNTRTASMNKAAKDFSTSYNFGFLSMMFIGQRFSRELQNIMLKTTSSYVALTQNSTEAAGAMTGLGAAMTMLQFTIGEAIATALMPLLPTLLDIIEIISDWIEQNPEWSAGILAGAFALFVLMTVAGTTYMLIRGLVGIWGQLAGLLGIGQTAGAGAAAGSTAGASLGAIAVAILWIVALLAILYFAWKHNFANIRGVVTDVVEAIKSTFGDFFGFFSDLISGNIEGAERHFVAFFVKLLAIVAKLFLFITDFLIGLAINIVAIVFDIITKFGTAVGDWWENKVLKPLVDGYNKLRAIFKKEPIEVDWELNNKRGEEAFGRVKDLQEYLTSQDMGFDLNFDKIDTWVGKNEEIKVSMEGTAMATDETTDALAGDGGLLPKMEEVTNFMDVSALPTFEDLTKQLGGPGGLNTSILESSTMLAGNEESLKSSLISTSDVTKNNLIPAVDSLTTKNYELAASFRSAADAARDYVKAAGAKKRAERDLEEKIQDEKNRF